MVVNKHIQKILALLMSISLWFYVLNSETIELKREFTIDYVLPEGQSFDKVPLDKMNILFKGPKAFLDSYLSSNNRLAIDLSLEKLDKRKDYKIDLKESYLDLPFGVEVVEFDKKAFSVSTGKEVSKDVPIQLNFIGKIQTKNKLVSSKVIPQKISIIGSKNILKNIKKLETRPIDLRKLTGEGSIEIGFIDLPETARISSDVNPQFQYKVVPSEINFVLKDIPIRFLSSRIIDKSSVKTVSLLVYIEDEEKVLTKSDVQVVADIPEGEGNKLKVKLKAEVPQGVHLLDISPNEISVNLK